MEGLAEALDPTEQDSTTRKQKVDAFVDELVSEGLATHKDTPSRHLELDTTTADILIPFYTAFKENPSASLPMLAPRLSGPANALQRMKNDASSEISLEGKADQPTISPADLRAMHDLIEGIKTNKNGTGAFTDNDANHSRVAHEWNKLTPTIGPVRRDSARTINSVSTNESTDTAATSSTAVTEPEAGGDDLLPPKPIFPPPSDSKTLNSQDLAKALGLETTINELEQKIAANGTERNLSALKLEALRRKMKIFAEKLAEENPSKVSINAERAEITVSQEIFDSLQGKYSSLKDLDNEHLVVPQGNFLSALGECIPKPNPSLPENQARDAINQIQQVSDLRDWLMEQGAEQVENPEGVRIPIRMALEMQEYHQRYMVAKQPPVLEKIDLNAVGKELEPDLASLDSQKPADRIRIWSLQNRITQFIVTEANKVNQPASDGTDIHIHLPKDVVQNIKTLYADAKPNFPELARTGKADFDAALKEIVKAATTDLDDAMITSETNKFAEWLKEGRLLKYENIGGQEVATFSHEFAAKVTELAQDFGNNRAPSVAPAKALTPPPPPAVIQINWVQFDAALGLQSTFNTLWQEKRDGNQLSALKHAALSRKTESFAHSLTQRSPSITTIDWDEGKITFSRNPGNLKDDYSRHEAELDKLTFVVEAADLDAAIDHHIRGTNNTLGDTDRAAEVSKVRNWLMTQPGAVKVDDDEIKIPIDMALKLEAYHQQYLNDPTQHVTLESINIDDARKQLEPALNTLDARDPAEHLQIWKLKASAEKFLFTRKDSKRDPDGKTLYLPADDVKNLSSLYEKAKPTITPWVGVSKEAFDLRLQAIVKASKPDIQEADLPTKTNEFAEWLKKAGLLATPADNVRYFLPELADNVKSLGQAFTEGKEPPITVQYLSHQNFDAILEPRLNGLNASNPLEHLDSECRKARLAVFRNALSDESGVRIDAIGITLPGNIAGDLHNRYESLSDMIAAVEPNIFNAAIKAHIQSVEDVDGLDPHLLNEEVKNFTHWLEGQEVITHDEDMDKILVRPDFIENLKGNYIAFTTQEQELSLDQFEAKLKELHDKSPVSSRHDTKPEEFVNWLTETKQITIDETLAGTQQVIIPKYVLDSLQRSYNNFTPQDLGSQLDRKLATTDDLSPHEPVSRGVGNYLISRPSAWKASLRDRITSSKTISFDELALRLEPRLDDPQLTHGEKDLLWDRVNSFLDHEAAPPNNPISIKSNGTVVMAHRFHRDVEESYADFKQTFSYTEENTEEQAYHRDRDSKFKKSGDDKVLPRRDLIKAELEPRLPHTGNEEKRDFKQQRAMDFLYDLEAKGKLSLAGKGGHEVRISKANHKQLSSEYTKFKKTYTVSMSIDALKDKLDPKRNDDSDLVKDPTFREERLEAYIDKLTQKGIVTKSDEYPGEVNISAKALKNIEKDFLRNHKRFYSPPLTDKQLNSGFLGLASIYVGRAIKNGAKGFVMGPAGAVNDAAVATWKGIQKGVRFLGKTMKFGGNALGLLTLSPIAVFVGTGYYFAYKPIKLLAKGSQKAYTGTMRGMGRQKDLGLFQSWALKTAIKMTANNPNGQARAREIYAQKAIEQASSRIEKQTAKVEKKAGPEAAAKGVKAKVNDVDAFTPRWIAVMIGGAKIVSSEGKKKFTPGPEDFEKLWDHVNNNLPEDNDKAQAMINKVMLTLKKNYQTGTDIDVNIYIPVDHPNAGTFWAHAKSKGLELDHEGFIEPDHHDVKLLLDLKVKDYAKRNAPPENNLRDGAQLSEAHSGETVKAGEALYVMEHGPEKGNAFVFEYPKVGASASSNLQKKVGQVKIVNVADQKATLGRVLTIGEQTPAMVIGQSHHQDDTKGLTRSLSNSSGFSGTTAGSRSSSPSGKSRLGK